MAAMYCMMYLLASVFPAPLSPGGVRHEVGEGTRLRVPDPIGVTLFYPNSPEMTMQVSLARRFMAL